MRLQDCQTLITKTGQLVDVLLKEERVYEAAELIGELADVHNFLRTSLWNGPANKKKAKELMAGISALADRVPQYPYVLGPERLLAEGVDPACETPEEAEAFFQSLVETGDPEESLREAKRPRGRPAGSITGSEPKSKALKVVLTPTAYLWVKTLPRGRFAQLVEDMARDVPLRM